MHYSTPFHVSSFSSSSFFSFSFSVLLPYPSNLRPNLSSVTTHHHPSPSFTPYPRLNNSNHCFNASAITSGRACTSLNTT